MTRAFFHKHGSLSFSFFLHACVQRRMPQSKLFKYSGSLLSLVETTLPLSIPLSPLIHSKPSLLLLYIEWANIGQNSGRDETDENLYAYTKTQHTRNLDYLVESRRRVFGRSSLCCVVGRKCSYLVLVCNLSPLVHHDFHQSLPCLNKLYTYRPGETPKGRPKGVSMLYIYAKAGGVGLPKPLCF